MVVFSAKVSLCVSAFNLVDIRSSSSSLLESENLFYLEQQTSPSCRLLLPLDLERSPFVVSLYSGAPSNKKKHRACARV